MTNEKNIAIDSRFAPMLYTSFLKHVPKNFRNVTHCAEVKGIDGKYLRVIQNKQEFKFKYDDISPATSFADLKTLEDRLFEQLKD